MENGVEIWNKVMKAALAVPGVKIDRNEFLTKELVNYNLTIDMIKQAVEDRPTNVISIEIIDKIANSCINNHTTKVTALSTLAGMPGGIALVGTIPADIAQYYYHVFVLAQKLAYLYGFPDLCDENGKLSDTAYDMLTLFVGVMMGIGMANRAIKDIAQKLAIQMVKRLPRQALTKTMWYPLLKNIMKYIGVKITKDLAGKSAGKIIPILGGLVSGVLTFATFLPCAKRLQEKLKETALAE